MKEERIMKKSTPRLTIGANGLTKVQAAAIKHEIKNPDGENFPVRVVDAKTLLWIMAAFLLTLTRPKLDEAYRATFMRVASWDDCIQWQGDLTLDGFVPSHVTHRMWEYFTGSAVPEGAHLSHACHHNRICDQGIFCEHRACANLTHWFLTTAKGSNSRSQNAPRRAKGKKAKIAAYKLTWTSCRKGHDTTPGKECSTCTKLRQRTFRDNIPAKRAAHEAARREREEQLAAVAAAAMAAEKAADLFGDLSTPTDNELRAMGYWVPQLKRRRSRKFA